MDASERRLRPDLKPLVRGRWARGYLALTAGIGILATVLAGRATGWFHSPKPSPAERTDAAVPEAPPPGGSATDVTALTSASRVTEARLVSGAIGRTMPYTVYLPPGYDADPTARYPVLYLLHGLGGSGGQWRDYGAFDAADRLIRTGEIPPMIIVLPEGEQAYWMDHANGGPRWGAYVAHDLVTEVDGRYRTLIDRAHRAIGGLSMGGHGALQLAMNNPDVFGVVGAHSFALRRHDIAPPYFGDRAYFDAHDPVHLFWTRPTVARAFKLWLDVGKDDPWSAADEAFHRQLQDEGIGHAWHVYPGDHSGEYWAAHVTDYLRFYGAALADAAGR